MRSGVGEGDSNAGGEGTSRSRASCHTCSASVPAACCRRWRTAKRIRPPWRRSRLRARPEELCDACQACPTLHPVYRRLLKLTLEELHLIEDHLGQLDQQMADLLAAHHD